MCKMLVHVIYQLLSTMILPVLFAAAAIRRDTDLCNCGACLDILVAEFWRSHFQNVYFDMKVFNPNVSSYWGSQTSLLYHRFEKDKRESMSSELGKLR